MKIVPNLILVLFFAFSSQLVAQSPGEQLSPSDNTLKARQGTESDRARIEPTRTPDRGQSSGPFSYPVQVPVRHLWGDIDNDGLRDLFVLDPKGNLLFRNLGDGGFEDITAMTFPNGAGKGGTGFWGDYNADKQIDLFLFQENGFKLFKNEGKLHFTDTTETLGFQPGLKVVGAELEDYDGDGYMDLLVQTPEGDQILRNRNGKEFGEVKINSPSNSNTGPRGSGGGKYTGVSAGGSSTPGGGPETLSTFSDAYVNDNSPGSVGIGVPEVEGGNDTITLNDIMDGTVVSADIAKYSLTGINIEPECLTGNQIEDDSVEPEKVQGIAATLTGNQNFDSGTLFIDATFHRVGIGTTNPDAALTVNGAFLRDGSTMYGAYSNTHVNLGNESQTGDNYLNSEYTTVGGGFNNTALGHYSTVCGGQNNGTGGTCSAIGGGEENITNGNYSNISGGRDNFAKDIYCTIGGGEENQATSDYATIGGGKSNYASSDHSTIGGGFDNSAIGHHSTVGGGESNYASGPHAIIPGGLDNTANGVASFAAGYKANALHFGSFVWADYTSGADFTSTGNNQFLIRASGGVGIGHTNPDNALHVKAPGTDSGGTAGYNTVVAHFLQTTPDFHSSISVDALPGQDPVVFLAEGGEAMWSLRHNASHERFQLRYHKGGAQDYMLTVQPNGDFGIGMSNPTHPVHVDGGAYCSGTQWKDACSRKLKKDIEDLQLNEALEAFEQLEPKKYYYKADDTDKHLGFIAEDVPELVAGKDRSGLSSMEIVTVLVKVVQHQQEKIEELEARIEEQDTRSR